MHKLWNTLFCILLAVLLIFGLCSCTSIDTTSTPAAAPSESTSENDIPDIPLDRESKEEKWESTLQKDWEWQS